jgi:hypothetical protein
MGGEPGERVQPSGQRIDGVGQSKHSAVEFACDMERRRSETVDMAISEAMVVAASSVE